MKIVISVSCVHSDYNVCVRMSLVAGRLYQGIDEQLATQLA